MLELNPLVSRIILINNSRSDASDWVNLKTSDKVICLSSLINSGYAGGNQLGYEILKSLKSKNHICVLNSDIIIPSDIFDIALNVLAKEETIGQISFRTIDERGNFMYDSIRLHGLLHEAPFKQTLQIEASDYAAGSFFILRNKAASALEYLFFEPYFLYWEEVDLSYRLRKIGWKIVCCTKSTIIRHSNLSSTNSRSIYYIVRNSFLFQKRNKIQSPNFIRFLLKYFLSSVRLSLLTRSASPIVNFILGFFDGARDKYGQHKF